MDKSAHASIEVALDWRSDSARHTDRYFFPKINLWRDILPGTMEQKITPMNEDETINETFDSGELVPQYETKSVFTVHASQFNTNFGGGFYTEPRQGRFYPKGLLTGVAGIYPQDTNPFRYLGKDNSGLHVDLNHPLAQYPMTLEAKLIQLLHTSEEHGGHCNDIAHAVTDKGPGLQAIRSDIETSFFSGQPFNRESDQEDASFYKIPRLVHHIDGAAMKRVTEIYTRFIRPGMSVLDLMSSWNSHLPDSVEELNVTGLGLNREEMERNERLNEVVIHDLNHLPELPVKQAQFDNVICTVSVEYLTRPVEVFQDVARVLKPGGYFIVTFSERWFPPKVVTVWTELHPFERIRLVLEYFIKSGRFSDLQTETIRGLLRPDDDKYATMNPLSDPVYAVWGKAIPG